MLQKISMFVQPEWNSSIRFGVSALLALSLVRPTAPTFAQQPRQRTFATTEDAAHALFAAKQARNEQDLLSILGPEGKDVISSGDPTEDRSSQQNFVDKYQEMHRFATESNGSVSLVIGAENWPFPIPLVNNHGTWYFDAPAGKEEILFRRIGRNELAAMHACCDLVEAEKRYLAHPRGDLHKQFAQKLVSDEGRHDGLCWHGAQNEVASPIDPLIAMAQGKKSEDQTGDLVPFNGYFFRILTSQARQAPGGAKNYVVDGKMTGGFAFVAYPVEYRSSGVMTFIVDETGVVYEKDLGPNTTKLAESLTGYDPDSTWHRVE